MTNGNITYTEYVAYACFIMQNNDVFGIVDPAHWLCGYVFLPQYTLPC